MKTLIGVDDEGHYKSALDLSLALGFPDHSVILAHVVRPLLHVMPVVMPTEIVTSTGEELLCKLGEKLVAQAAASVPAHVACRSLVSVGTPIQKLLAVAGQEKVDLLALGSGRKYGPSYYFGSISRAMVVSAPQSLLVGKGDIPKGRKLRAVFATDHSEYANKCLQKFCSWKALGVSEIHLLTAFDVGDEASRIMRGIEAPIDVEGMITERLQELSTRSAMRLRELGYSVTIEVARGYPNEAIADVMRRRSADLLILGARGHGFIDPALIGSVSLHQISREHYPVLLMRI